MFAQRTAEPKSNEKTMGEGATKRMQREKKRTLVAAMGYM